MHKQKSTRLLGRSKIVTCIISSFCMWNLGGKMAAAQFFHSYIAGKKVSWIKADFCCIQFPTLYKKK